MKKNEAAGTIVVGGGLAGLTAALSLARRGRPVTVLEKAADLGGRARTRVRDGFHLNLGPHALYRGGPGQAILDRLGIDVSGHAPPVSGGYAFDGGRLHTLPVGIASLLTTGLLDLREKAALARFIARLASIDAASPALATRSVAEWLDSLRLRRGARRMVQALVRLTTYSPDVDRLSAGAAIAQLQAAQRAGVRYLDGGWQSLVQALAEAAGRAGAAFVSSAPVVAIERGAAVTGVRLADGTVRAAEAVIVAAGPEETAALLTGDDAVSVRRSSPAPVFMASLDLALARLPRPRSLFALGVDRPLYLSVHSATARLAPEGGALIHAAMYLGSPPATDPVVVQREIEGLVDLVQPGWRDAVVHARFLPRLVVANGLPAADQGGLPGRPGPAVAGVPGLFVAGDWVGPAGLLADASLASAAAAADAVLAHTRGSVRAA
jgi:phytoene dehydrogenase-like protein